jgi:methyl-accepting chemotaxis protein
MASIRKLLSVGAVTAAALATTIAVVNAWSVFSLGNSLDRLEASSSRLRDQTYADMMHDALRGDVYGAIIAGMSKAGGKADAIKALDQHIAALKDNLAKEDGPEATRELSEVARGIRPVVDDYAATARKLVELGYDDPAVAQARLPAFNAVFARLEGEMDRLGDLVGDQGKQIAVQSERQRSIALAVAGLGGLAIVLVFLTGLWWMRRNVVHPIATMQASLDSKESSPELKALTERPAGDEMGDLARSLEAFRTASVAASRIKAAMDACPTNAMLVDADNIIVYVNQAADRLVHEHVADFRQAVASFDPDKVLGRDMGIFHKNREHQDRMVRALTKPHTSRVKVGGRTFDLVVTPVFGEAGERTGAFLEWRDLTADMAAQSDVRDLVAAAAEGDFSRRVRTEGRTGFLRDVGEGMNTLNQLFDRATTDFTSVITALAEGDLTRSVSADYQGRLGELTTAINGTTSRLAELVRTIQATTQEVSSSAREITSGADDLSQRTESQAANLEETAATTEQLAASVKASADASRQAVSLAENAMSVAENGGTIVSQAVEAMARIEQASRKIADITGVIDEIAFQTNLLALNAAVEAARAGDAGKGFAVVASEVRSLAQRSSEAAKDISGLIHSSTVEVSQGVQLVRSAGDALNEIVGASRKVSSTVSEISTASNEQANGIDEMSQAVSQMDEMTQQNAALAEQSAASANALNEQIDRLNRLIATFRTGAEAAGRAGDGVPEPERRRRMVQGAFARSA